MAELEQTPQEQVNDQTQDQGGSLDGALCHHQLSKAIDPEMTEAPDVGGVTLGVSAHQQSKKTLILKLIEILCHRVVRHNPSPGKKI